MAHKIEEEIIRIVGRLRRKYGRVYPWMVACWMDNMPCSERTVRRYMSRMAGIDDGRLVRCGERGGYTI